MSRVDAKRAAKTSSSTDEPPAPAGAAGNDASASGREEHLKMLAEYRSQWEESGGLLKRTARRVHRFLWWLMCFTGLDVLDYHERALLAVGYLAALALVAAGAAKQLQALAALLRRLAAARAAAAQGEAAAAAAAAASAAGSGSGWRWRG